MRSDVKILDRTCAHRLAVTKESPLHGDIFEILEEVFIVDAQKLVGFLRGPDVLIYLLSFVGMRIEHTFGAYETVDAEIVVACVIVVEVAAVCHDGNAVFPFPAHSLINEIPDVSALIFRIFAHEIPIFLEAAE